MYILVVALPILVSKSRYIYHQQQKSKKKPNMKTPNLVTRAQKIWKLKRTAPERKALFKTMVTQLVEHERIKTTYTKVFFCQNTEKKQALALRTVADRVIALGIRGDDHAARKLKKYLRTDQAFDKVMNSLVPRFD